MEKYLRAVQELDIEIWQLNIFDPGLISPFYPWYWGDLTLHIFKSTDQ